MGSSRLLASTAVLALMVGLIPSPSRSTETITYSYDALGRLVKAQSSGSVNNNHARSLCYDASGNRIQYRVDAAGAVASCSGSPTPSPTPTPTPTPGPSFSINDVSGTEGNTLIFTVTRSGNATGSYSVSYATANGTATTQDYTVTSGTLTFAAGQTSRTISVATTLDLRVEATEYFYVNLSNPTGGATISDGQGRATLFNDDSVCTTC